MKGKYIVIEGQDATGKSTQVEMLAKYLRNHNYKVTTMHEPDGDLPSSHALRDIIKDKDYNLEPLTHVLLFSAARLELWQKLAEPLLADGGIVISARNWWSTLAYQGYGQDVDRKKIAGITKSILPKSYVVPTHAAILTLDDDVRLSRQTSRDDNSSKDTFESKPDSFQQRVNDGYLDISRTFDIPTLDAAGSIEDVQGRLLKLFDL